MSEMPFIDPPSQFTADTLPVRETTIDQIDLERVATHIAEAKQRERYEGSDDPMEYLRSRRCLVRVGTSDYLTVTGILSFSRAPQAIFPHAVVDIEHYTHNDVIATDLVYAEPGVGGSIFNQIDYLETYLWQNTHHGTTLISKNLQQAEVHEYPRAAIRQLAVHMLAQRDYAIYAIASRAQLFGNRIEWTAPGGLPAGQNIEELLSAYQPRNPNIAQVLYEAGYLTTPQQGPEATTAILRSEKMLKPMFIEVGTSLVATMYGRTREAMYGVVGNYTYLSDIQRMILQYIISRGEVPTRDIRAQFSERAGRSLQRDLKILGDHGLILSRGGSRAVQYRASLEPTEEVAKV